VRAEVVLTEWISEDFSSNSDTPLDGECNFFNFTTMVTSAFCAPFTISRMGSAILRTASERALRCVAKHDVECVLSTEIGLAVPALFLADHESAAGVRTLLAPRMLAHEPSGAEYVRVCNPSGGITDSITVQFNASVRVEFLDSQKQVKTEILTGKDAFCVQLLRVAFEDACWAELDG